MFEALARSVLQALARSVECRRQTSHDKAPTTQHNAQQHNSNNAPAKAVQHRRWRPFHFALTLPFAAAATAAVAATAAAATAAAATAATASAAAIRRRRLAATATATAAAPGARQAAAAAASTSAAGRAAAAAAGPFLPLGRRCWRMGRRLGGEVWVRAAAALPNDACPSHRFHSHPLLLPSAVCVRACTGIVALNARRWSALPAPMKRRWRTAVLRPQEYVD